MKQIKSQLKLRQLTAKSKYQSWEFTVVGQISEWIASKKSQIKYLKLVNGSEQKWIKLSKKSRNSLGNKLIPGCWLKVKVEKKLYFKTGFIQLKAKKIICYNQCPFKGLLAPGLFLSEQSYLDSPFYCQIEAGLQEHFRIRGNFKIKKLQSKNNIRKSSFKSK